VFPQASDDTGAVCLGAVLTHLPFAFDAGDRNLDADDAAKLRRDIFRRRVIDRPWRRARALMRTRETFDIAAQPLGIFDHVWFAPSVNGGVVPGWHDLAGFALGFVPGWRYILLRALENNEAFLDCAQLAPMRISARNMAMQCAVLRGVWKQQERNGIGHEAALPRADQETERVHANERVLDLKPVFAEMGRLVHA
jgi:hypothetical protein